MDEDIVCAYNYYNKFLNVFLFCGQEDSIQELILMSDGRNGGIDWYMSCYCQEGKF